jgi:glucose/mannose transport system substrate-binding protein
MGDWAKGEFLAAGKVPGKDFLLRAGTGQRLHAELRQLHLLQGRGRGQSQGPEGAGEPDHVAEFQETFNLAKGSIPARVDVPLDEFDDLRQAKSHEDLLKAAPSLVRWCPHGA